MSTIAFIGLGNMGGPMAVNLVKAGHAVRGHDLSASAMAEAASRGVHTVPDAVQALARAEAVVTMLPAGPQVRALYLDTVLAAARPGALLIDCSTIDVETARAVADTAAGKGFAMVDAPVSGGVAAAAGGTLTFMVGGPDDAVARARPILEAMGKTVVHTGGPGTGQAAKICNNMMLGIQMISVAEGFALAEKLGLAPDKLFAVSSAASGQCWSLTSYCPEPGLVETSPANRDYRPGFAAAMMLKDLDLAGAAAAATGASTPLGAAAAALYRTYCDAGEGESDFSGIIRMLKRAPDPKEK